MLSAASILTMSHDGSCTSGGRPLRACAISVTLSPGMVCGEVITNAASPLGLLVPTAGGYRVSIAIDTVLDGGPCERCTVVYSRAYWLHCSVAIVDLNTHRPTLAPTPRLRDTRPRRTRCTPDHSILRPSPRRGGWGGKQTVTQSKPLVPSRRHLKQASRRQPPIAVDREQPAAQNPKHI